MNPSDFFDQFAPHWWPTSSNNTPGFVKNDKIFSTSMELLHDFNRIRLDYIWTMTRDLMASRDDNVMKTKKVNPSSSLRVLDIGCAGGILCEPLARAGPLQWGQPVELVGIDPSLPSIVVAEKRAVDQGLPITYINTNLEHLDPSINDFDLIIASEVIEHVINYRDFIALLHHRLAPNGVVFVSTLNRSPWSYIGAIMMAQGLLGWVPSKTHQWKAFVTPKELGCALEEEGVKVVDTQPFDLNPLTRQFRYGYRLGSKLIDKTINYMVCGKKMF